MSNFGIWRRSSASAETTEAKTTACTIELALALARAQTPLLLECELNLICFKKALTKSSDGRYKLNLPYLILRYQFPKFPKDKPNGKSWKLTPLSSDRNNGYFILIYKQI